jgi:hypothetical protein
MAGKVAQPESMLLGFPIGGFPIVQEAAAPHIIFASYGKFGMSIDVTAEVQAAANMKVPFVFNNAMNPGGIVNVAQDTVLVAIIDPAYGYVKDVHIVYDGGVIDAAEYETITL